ncbi:MAG: AAA family ATPase [Chitinimonas sp.]|nr:AAA family ATPase [Chitinimonas sp.]
MFPALDLQDKPSEQHQLDVLLHARHPIITVESDEEPRFLALIEQLARRQELPLFSWTAVDGLIRRITAETQRPTDTYELHHALRHLYKSPQNGVFVFFDAHPFLDDAVTIRLIKSLVHQRHQTQRTLIFFGPDVDLPGELKRFSTTFTLSPPSADDIRKLIHQEAQVYAKLRGGARVKASSEILEQLVRLLAGLNMDDIHRLVREVIDDDGMLTEADLRHVAQAKNHILNQDGMLSFEADTGRFAELGGLAGLKRWLALREHAFGDTQNPKDSPKGLLLTGVQGCGKSLAAKCVAGSWGLPLLRLDFGVLYNKFFGETERNLRSALAAANRMAPCVLWIDEIEKGLGTDSTGADSGVSRRVLGTLLTWMAERKHPVFIVATANDIESLPPELIRKGRLDEIFFVDLPGQQARQEIWRIHLSQRNESLTPAQLSELLDASEGYSGAEIEQAVVASRFAAQTEGQPLTQAHLLAELARTRPLSLVMAERIAAMREWAQERAVMADDEAAA